MELQATLKEFDQAIAGESNDIASGIMRHPDPVNDPINVELRTVMDHAGVNFSIGSELHEMLRRYHGYAKRSYLRELIEYNNSFANFQLSEPITQANSVDMKQRPRHNIHALIEEYLQEDKKGLNIASHKEKAGSLRYLIDWLGQDSNIAKINGEKAREVKNLLLSTPKQRNVSALTSGLPLLEQIEVASAKNILMLRKGRVQRVPTFV